MTISEALQKLETLQKQLYAYGHAMSILYIDAVTAAPPDTAAGRGEALGVLSAASYQLKTDPSVPEMLFFLRDHRSEISDLAGRQVDKLIEEYEKMSKVPMDEYVAIQRLLNTSENVWHKAKAENDFASFAPYLEKVIASRIRLAGYYAPEKDPYDYWLEEHEKGFTTEKLDVFFSQLREKIVPLIRAVGQCPPIDDSFLFRRYPVEAQRQLSDALMKILCIDRGHCSIAETEHPFTCELNKYDVRITTHYYEDNVASSMYSVIHEGGHALYELGGGDALQYTCLAGGTSMGIHESQSRFFENMIGRSRGFIDFVFPLVQELFPQQLAGVGAEDFYRAVNKAQPSLIRIEADELTYCLHIMVRYELEKRLFRGELAVKELPAAWNALMQEYLGLEVPDDTHGVLQDSHWGGGMMGYFPSYALGSAYAAQMLAVMRRSLDVDALTARGELAPIIGWLRERIHRYGSARKADEVLSLALEGEPFDPTYYTDYLVDKYSALYGL